MPNDPVMNWLAPVREAENKLAHDEARADAVMQAGADGYFDRDPYSIYPRRTEFDAPCGCTYDTRDGTWNDRDCREES